MATLGCNMKGVHIIFRPDLHNLQVTEAEQEAEHLLKTMPCSYVQQGLSSIILHGHEFRKW